MFCVSVSIVLFVTLTLGLPQNPRDRQQNVILFSKQNHQRNQQNTGIIASPLLSRHQDQLLHNQQSSIPAGSDEIEEIEYEYYEDPNGDIIYYEDVSTSSAKPSSSSSSSTSRSNSGTSSGASSGLTSGGRRGSSNGFSSTSGSTSASSSSSAELSGSHLGFNIPNSLSGRKVAHSRLNNLPKSVQEVVNPARGAAVGVASHGRERLVSKEITSSSSSSVPAAASESVDGEDDEEYETIYYEDLSGEVGGAGPSHTVHGGTQQASPETETQLTVSVSTKNTSPATTTTSSTTLPSSTTSQQPKRIVSFTKNVTPRPRPTTKNSNVRFTRPTGSSVVVAVQTSRSVVTPPTPAPSSSPAPHSLPESSSKSSSSSLLNGSEDAVAVAADEEEYTYPDNYPLPNSQEQQSSLTVTSTTQTPLQTQLSSLQQAAFPSQAPDNSNSNSNILHVTESIMDKLDQVGSDLVNRLFNTAGISSNSGSTTNKSIATILGIGKRTTTTTSTTTTVAPSSLKIDSGIKFEDVSAFLPSDYFSKKGQGPEVQEVLPPPPPASVPAPEQIISSTTELEPEVIFSTTVASTTTSATKKNPFKIEFQEIDFSSLAGLLPKDYKPPPTPAPEIPTTPSTTTTTTTTTTQVPITSTSDSTAEKKPIDPLLAIMKKITFDDDISALLPPGYKEQLGLTSTTIGPSSSPVAAIPTVATSTATAPAASGPVYKPPAVVFPSRLGGLKPIGMRPTTPVPITAETPGPLKVTLKPAGWPSRKTTEFTGWPTVSTTPTTTVETTTTTATTTTTTPRTTTTTQPPKRYPPSMCEVGTCKMEATLRIISGVHWKELYREINTDEWKQLESTVKRELDGAYRSSALAPYYKAVKIEAFNRGSVIVDYFVYLDGVDREITSEQVRVFFHGALLQPTVNDGATASEDEDGGERLRLGRYVIDPKYTDFKVRNSTLDASELLLANSVDPLIPHWAIAVIVISLTCLMFTIIFIITIVVTKNRNAKKGHPNGISLTQEMLNEFNKSQGFGGGTNGGGTSGLGMYNGHPAFAKPGASTPDDLYNMDDVWSDAGGGGGKSAGSVMSRTFDRKPAKRSSIISSIAGREYNIYDSWKTEWNGYSGGSHNNQQLQQTSSSSQNHGGGGGGGGGGSSSYYGGDSHMSYALPPQQQQQQYSRRRGPPIPDYDTNF